MISYTVYNTLNCYKCDKEIIQIWPYDLISDYDLRYDGDAVLVTCECGEERKIEKQTIDALMMIPYTEKKFWEKWELLNNGP
jgi:hypothetical protein